MRMERKPKFSIITITFNAAAVIEPTLKSVLAQTYTNYEYLLIDGGSKDDTVEKARKSGIEFAHIVSEPDNGLYDAMNKGISLASGDYLCFLNAGDAFYAPETLQTIADAATAEETLPDVLYGETAEVDEARNFVRMRRLRLNADFLKKTPTATVRLCEFIRLFYTLMEMICLLRSGSSSLKTVLL